MVVTSSTSSSETPRTGRFPWAFLIAILIVIVVELFLRTRDRQNLIAYPELGVGGDQTVTYYAVREYIELGSEGDVVLVGSSQMREAVVMPRLIQRVDQELGRPVRIRNYATRGARADVMEAVVKTILEQPRKPSLMIIGLSVRDLRTQVLDLPRLAIFWRLSDWWQAFREIGSPVTSVLPIVIRNEFSRICYSLRYRDQLSIELSKPLARWFGYSVAREPNPIIGQMSWQHLGGRGLRNLVNPRISPRRMLIMARQSYAYEEGPKPSEPQTRRLQSLIRRTETSGVPTLIVEMPVADYLQKDLSARKLPQEFQRSVRSLVNGTSIRFIPVSEQPFQPDRTHFSDLQHFNRRGAEQFSDYLAELIVQHLSDDHPESSPHPFITHSFYSPERSDSEKP